MFIVKFILFYFSRFLYGYGKIKMNLITSEI